MMAHPSEVFESFYRMLALAPVSQKRIFESVVLDTNDSDEPQMSQGLMPCHCEWVLANFRLYLEQLELVSEEWEESKLCLDEVAD